MSGKEQTVARRAAVAGLLGTFIETFDFAVYAYLVVYTAPLFFPSGDPTVAILASLMVFAAGFVARPLGGIFFGRMGDRRGRRRTLVVTVAGMGASTCAMGLLPTHAQVGVVAPILLVVVRLVQGFCAGGEIMGAATYVAESGSARRHGLFSSAAPVGAAAGIAFAPAVVGLAAVLLPGTTIGEWGWRIPLLLSLPMTIATLLYRLRLEDSPVFQQLAAREELPNAPFRETLRLHWRAVLRVAALAISINLAGYTLNTYIPLYLQTVVKLPAGSVYWLAAITLTLALPATVLSGYAIDRFGRNRVMVSSLAACAVLAYPAMVVMGNAASTVVAVGALYWLLLCAVQAASTPAYVAFVGLFPARVRYTGAAIGYNVGTIAGGGFAPYAAAQLTTVTGNSQSPALLIGGAALIGILTIVTSPSTRSDLTPPAQDVADAVVE